MSAKRTLTIVTLAVVLLGCGSAPARPREPSREPAPPPRAAPAAERPAAPRGRPGLPSIPVESSLPFPVDAACEDHGEQLVPGYGDGVKGARTTEFASHSYAGESLRTGRGRVFVLRVAPPPEADGRLYTATFLDAQDGLIAGPVPLKRSWTIAISHDRPVARVRLAPKE